MTTKRAQRYLTAQKAVKTVTRPLKMVEAVNVQFAAAAMVVAAEKAVIATNHMSSRLYKVYRNLMQREWQFLDGTGSAISQGYLTSQRNELNIPAGATRLQQSWTRYPKVQKVKAMVLRLLNR